MHCPLGTPSPHSCFHSQSNYLHIWPQFVHCFVFKFFWDAYGTEMGSCDFFLQVNPKRPLQCSYETKFEKNNYKEANKKHKKVTTIGMSNFKIPVRRCLLCTYYYAVVIENGVVKPSKQHKLRPPYINHTTTNSPLRWFKHLLNPRPTHQFVQLHTFYLVPAGPMCSVHISIWF